MAETAEKEPMNPELAKADTETIDEPGEKLFSRIKTPKELYDLLFNIMCSVRGIDPNQVQSMSKFSNFDNDDERSYYPTQLVSVAIAQLRMFGQGFYRGEDWNEYEDVANLLAVGFMGYKGFKSEQYKDITSGQPNLDKLKGLPEETQKGILSGLFNRGSKE